MPALPSSSTSRRARRHARGRRWTWPGSAGRRACANRTCRYVSQISAAACRSASEFPTNERGPRGEGLQLAERDIARERHHAAVGAGIELLRRHESHRRADRRRDLPGFLHGVVRDVDGSDQDVLALEKREQLERHARIRALQRNLVDLRSGEHGKGGLVWPPFGTEGLL